MSRVPLDRDAVGLYCLTARIDGAPATLMLDSGATHTILDRSSAQRRGLEAEARPNDRVASVGAFATTTTGRAVVRLELGAVDIATIELMVVNLGEVCRARLEQGACAIDGILGADFLHDHKAIIALAEPALYLAITNGAS